MMLQGRQLGMVLGKRTILEDVSLEVGPGEIVGLLGPNGAGKTTAFGLLSGVIRPASGSVFLGDRDLTGVPLHERALCGVTYIPQDGSVFLRLTVRDNLLAIPQALGSPNPPHFERIVAGFGLRNCLDSYGSVLSGGERKRVEICRALLHGARYFLLDEPFAGLDPRGRAEVTRALIQLRDDGAGVFVTDHRFEDVLKLSTRVYVLAGGKLVAQGAPETVSQDSLALSAYFG